jgi:hypothetical protein
MDGNNTVNYQYNQKPEYRYFQIYSNCQSGQGFSPTSLAGISKLEAEAYFKLVDPAVFSTMRYLDESSVEIVFPPASCSMQDQTDFQLSLEAANAGIGTLSFQFGNFFGSRQINLQAGTNLLTLPIPAGSLNRWLYENGSFRFIYLDDNCVTQSSVRQVALCDISAGVNLGINNPALAPPIMVDLAVSAVCQQQDDNVIFRPSVPVFYRPSCSTEKTFQRLGYIQDGVFSGALPLTIGADYDFRVQLGGSVSVYENITIPASSASYNLGDQSLTLEFLDGELFFRINDFQLPAGVCSFIG